VPLPESQLAELPVHVHRTPTKKSKKHGGGPFGGSNTFSPRAACDGKAQAAPPAAGPEITAAAAPLYSQPAAAAQAPRVPVVQELPHRHWLLPAAQPEAPAYLAASAGGSSQSHGSSGSLAARAAPSSSSSSSSLAPAASRVGSTQQLWQAEAPQASWLPPAPAAAAAGAWSVAAAAVPAAGDSGESEDDDEVLCSVCLEPFAEGAKVRALSVSLRPACLCACLLVTPACVVLALRLKLCLACALCDLPSCLLLLLSGQPCCWLGSCRLSSVALPLLLVLLLPPPCLTALLPLCFFCCLSPALQILSLPCRHQYHEECVKTWLRYKGAEATCPNCISRVWQAQS
jgi:hypothetical protein